MGGRRGVWDEGSWQCGEPGCEWVNKGGYLDFPSAAVAKGEWSVQLAGNGWLKDFRQY